MMPIIQSGFFLVFCATSGLGVYLAHRMWGREAKPTPADSVLALIAALLCLAFTAMTYRIRSGGYTPPHIDPGTATVVTALTCVGIAFVCLRVALPDPERAE